MTNDELPQGWTKASVTSLIGADGLFSDGDWVESKDQDPNGSIRLLQLADIGDGAFIDKSNRFINEEKFETLRCEEVLEGDVLIARMPDPLGRACLAPKLKQKSITVVDVAILRPGEFSVSPRWLMHSINSPQVRAHIEMESSGTTRKRIARGKLAEMELPLAPLAEQKRIADKLEAVLGRVDACLDRLDRVPDLLKRFRQSVLAAATSGQLTEDWRNTFNANNEQADRGAIQQLNEKYCAPERWPTTTFAELTHLITSGSRGWADYYSEAGAVFIRAQNINSDRLVLDDVAYVSLPEKAEGKRALVKRDDLLITITGANVGKSARVMIDLEEAYISQHVALLKLNDPRLAAFLELFLWAENAGRWQLNEAAYGGGKPGLNLQNIRELVVAIPPLAEQAEIVRRVEALFALADRIEARLATAQRLVERLTPATLSKAFRGDLVPQDPNDEPASVLLLRLTEGNGAKNPLASAAARRSRTKTTSRPKISVSLKV